MNSTHIHRFNLWDTSPCTFPEEEGNPDHVIYSCMHLQDIRRKYNHRLQGDKSQMANHPIRNWLDRIQRLKSSRHLHMKQWNEEPTDNTHTICNKLAINNTHTHTHTVISQECKTKQIKQKSFLKYPLLVVATTFPVLSYHSRQLKDIIKLWSYLFTRYTI